MSGNRRPQGSIQLLSVGNIVSTGVYIYRSHFKSYLSLSAKAHLWVLLPIYGWAKFSAISAMISRLAFAELIDQPESIEMAQKKVNSKLWSFLWLACRVGIFLGLIYIGYIGLSMAGAILVVIIFRAIFTVIHSVTLSTIQGDLSWINILAGGIMLLITLTGFMWFYARWMISEVPLAVEKNLNAAESMSRSWNLSQNSSFRIQAIALIVFVVSLPILAIINYLSLIFLVGIERGSFLYGAIDSISNIIIILIGGAFIMPFWQTIKAAIYYDLRSRREGLGLKLRDHKI